MRTFAGKLTALVVAGLVVSPSTALGHDHRRPRALLITGRDRQQPHLVTFTWERRSGQNQCVLVHGDGFAGFPEALEYESGHRVRVRFFKKQRPQDVKIRVYRRATKNGAPAGKSHPVRHHLRKRRLNDRVVWDAVFRRHRIGHHYLDVTARWRDRNGCGDSWGQELEITFHLRAR